MPLMFLVYTAYSTSQLYEYSMAKINARLEIECKGNVILEFLWSNIILLFMFLFMMTFYFIVVINLKH